MVSYHRNYDTEIAAQHTSDVAYGRNSTMSYKFTTTHYFTNMQCD